MNSVVLALFICRAQIFYPSFGGWGWYWLNSFVIMPIFQAEKIRQVNLEVAEDKKYLTMKLPTNLPIQPGQFVLVDGHPFTVASIGYNGNTTKNLTFVVEVSKDATPS